MNRETATRRRRIKSKPGDMFAIDLSDGSWSLGHVVAEDVGICCVLLDVRAASVDALRAMNDASASRPIGVLVTTDVEIRAGRWPIVGHRPPNYPGIRLPKLSGEGSLSYTVRVLADFLDAYYGLRPWNEWPMSPTWNRDILLPHLPIPPSARFQGPALSPPASAAKPPPVTDGPAMVTIQLVYPGTGMPSIELLRKRQEMERRIEAAGAGEVEGAESGAGVMEIFLRTGDVRRAVPLVEKIAAEMGFAEDMLIETAGLDEEAEEP